MRYFIAQNGSTVVDKQAFAGDNSQIDAIVSKYKQTNPALVVSEVDQLTFNATALVPAQTQAQKDWAALKASGPTPLQAILFIAKFLGLE